MIANSAFLAAMILLLLAFSILGQVEFLAPYRHVIFVQHLWVVVGGLGGRVPQPVRGVLPGRARALPQGHRAEARPRRAPAPHGGHRRPRPLRTIGGGGVRPCREMPATIARRTQAARRTDPLTAIARAAGWTCRSRASRCRAQIVVRRSSIAIASITCAGPRVASWKPSGRSASCPPPT